MFPQRISTFSVETKCGLLKCCLYKTWHYEWIMMFIIIVMIITRQIRDQQAQEKPAACKGVAY